MVSSSPPSSSPDTDLSRSLRICGGIYGLAAVGAVATAIWVPTRDTVWIAFWADLAATVIVFGFSWRFGNSSIYDPYWSVAPLPIAIYWMLNPSTLETSVPRQLLVLLLVGWWAVRLTYNWARSWGGIDHEDWRYRDLRDRTGRFYWVTSFAGIHTTPTLVVFLGCMPLFAVFSSGIHSFGILDLVAATVTAGAIWIEATADKQLILFRRSRPGPQDFLRSGLWAYSRHPNYFGEISFWWGLYLFGLAADPGYWWTIAGPLSVTLLFRGVSLKLIEDRMSERRPTFAEYQKTVPAFVPWPRRASSR